MMEVKTELDEQNLEGVSGGAAVSAASLPHTVFCPKCGSSDTADVMLNGVRVRRCHVCGTDFAPESRHPNFW